MKINQILKEDAEPIDREFALVKKLGRLGERIVQNPRLWDRYDEAVSNDNTDWIIGLIQDGTGATANEVTKLADLFGEIGGGLGRIIDFAWAVKEGTWDKDFMNPYRAHRSQGLNEFARDDDGRDDGGEDPYKYPKPQHYDRSIDFFGRFEADHFDDEVFDKATGVFKGYWDDQEGRDQIAYFKFDNPQRTGDDDPGMGWYYEPQNESVAEGQQMGEYGRVLSALGLYVPDKFSMEELNTPDWHRVIANKANVPVEYAGKVIDDFTRPVDGYDDDEWPEDDENVAEGAGNIGSAIKSLYQKIYRAGDDEIDYFYHASPIFAQYWDEYEGDLDSIIAEVDPSELEVIKAELESYVDDANLAEGAENPYGYEVGQQVELAGGQQGQVTDIFDGTIEVLLPDGRTAVVDFQDATVVDEGIKGEIAGGAVGSLVGGAAGAPLGMLGNVVGSAVGGSVGSAIGSRWEDGKPLKEKQQLDEMIPLLAAGARLFMAAAPKIAQVIGRAGQASARGAGQVAKSGAEIAAKNAGQIGLGTAAYEIGSSIPDIVKDITAKVGTAVDEKTIFELATVAFKYAIPAGIVLAIMYGGKKAIDSIFDNSSDKKAVAETKPKEKEADYGPDYQDMVARVKKLAGLGPLKTVYDPQKRVYKNVPTAVQPKKEQR